MQPLSTTPGFWFVNANIAAVESLSVIVTVPAEKVFPAFSVVPDSAARAWPGNRPQHGQHDHAEGEPRDRGRPRQAAPGPPSRRRWDHLDVVTGPAVDAVR